MYLLIVIDRSECPGNVLQRLETDTEEGTMRRMQLIYFVLTTCIHGVRCFQAALMVTANVPSAKKIIVHGPDLSSIPSQFPIHEVSYSVAIMTKPVQ